MRKQAIVCVLLLGAALAFAAPVRAQQIEITEWPVSRRYSVKHKTMMFPFQ